MLQHPNGLDGNEIIQFPDLDKMDYPPKKESTCTVAWYKAVLVPVFNQHGGLQSTNSNYQPVVNNVFLKSEKGTWNIEPY
jgi:hypothetical protein